MSSPSGSNLYQPPQRREEPLSAEKVLAMRAQEFLTKEAAWFQETGDDRPVYCLPSPLIQCLSEPDGIQPAVLSEIESQRESRLAAICREADAVGIWGDRFIKYPYLLSHDGFSEETSVDIGEKNRQSSVKQLSSETWTKLKGYAGWLMTDPIFSRERDEVRRAWKSSGAKSEFPFERETIIENFEIMGKPVWSEAILGYRRLFNDFLRHWNIAQMTTWDLPLPFGPVLFADSETYHCPTAPLSVTVLLPVNYPLTSTDGLLEQIKQAQRRVAEKHSPSDIASIPHYNAYAQMFEVQHLESCIRSRCIRGGRRKGGISSMEAAIATTMGLGIEQVKRHRKSISACLRGKRDSLPWLKK